MRASSRFRNSGLNSVLERQVVVALAVALAEADRPAREIGAPTLLVMIRTTWRKSVFLPLLSVSVPWSITWSSTLKTSGCAFSISSSKQHGVRRLGDRFGQEAAAVVADVARRRADQPRDGVALLYSLMSKRMSSMPSVLASCLATSVLPTPVGPVKR